MNCPVIHGRFHLFLTLHILFETVACPLDRGVDIDIGDTIGWTPLVICARHGYTEILKLLVARGALVYMTDDGGRDALSAAIEFGQELCVESLAQHYPRNELFTYIELMLYLLSGIKQKKRSNMLNEVELVKRLQILELLLVEAMKNNYNPTLLSSLFETTLNKLRLSDMKQVFQDSIGMNFRSDGGGKDNADNSGWNGFKRMAVQILNIHIEAILLVWSQGKIIEFNSIFRRSEYLSKVKFASVNCLCTCAKT